MDWLLAAHWPLFMGALETPVLLMYCEKQQWHPEGSGPQTAITSNQMRRPSLDTNLIPSLLKRTTLSGLVAPQRVIQLTREMAF